MKLRHFGAAGVLALGIAVALSTSDAQLGAAAPQRPADQKTQQSGQNKQGSFTLIGCVERENGGPVAGSAGSGESNAPSATSGSNAARYKLTKVDRESIEHMSATLGQLKSAKNDPSSYPSAVSTSGMDISKTTEFVLRPVNGKVKVSRFVGQRVAATGELNDAALALAGPTAAGATGTAGLTGTVHTSRLDVPGLDVTYIEKVPGSCK